MESVGNGTVNPAIISTESLIQGELTSEREEQLQELEGYGGRWRIRSTRPTYGKFGRGEIRIAFSDMLICALEMRS